MAKCMINHKDKLVCRVNNKEAKKRYNNGNGKWDTGNYLKMMQPEKVSYYPDVIDVRANWELEQNFIISE